MIDADRLVELELLARKRLPKEAIESAKADRAKHPSLVAAIVSKGLLPRTDALSLLKDLKSEWPSLIDIERLLPLEAPPGSEDEEWIGGDDPIDPSLIPKPPGA